MITLSNTVMAQQLPLPYSLKNTFNNSTQSPFATTSSAASQPNQVPATSSSSSSLSSKPSELSLLAPQIEKSVVSVTGTNSTTIDQGNNSLGTGFVYDTQGHIITTYGVINGSQNQNVRFSDGTTYKARVVGFDPYSDIAILSLEGVPLNKLIPLKFIDNSSNALVGEQVATIGNPFGIDNLLSSGIISGLHKYINIDTSNTNGKPSFPLTDTIVSTVPTNPGNAGGPLFNMKGEVIGMDSSIYSSSGNFAGISIAVPSNIIKIEVPQIIEFGTYKHPWLGITGMDLTPEILSAIGLNNTVTKGVIVISVAQNSPAFKAGITNGSLTNRVNLGNNVTVNSDADIIVGIDNKPVNSMNDMSNYIASKSVMDTIVLNVLRNGTLQNVNVHLMERPVIVQ